MAEGFCWAKRLTDDIAATPDFCENVLGWTEPTAAGDGAGVAQFSDPQGACLALAARQH